MNDELLKGEGMLVPQRIPKPVNGVGLQQFNISQNVRRMSKYYFYLSHIYK
jgi:hypothetical protein